jgi:hypothetical protein
MCYWALINAKNSLIKLHSSQCHTCSNGRGPSGNPNGHWKGPFTSYVEAFNWARESRKYVENCKFCHPQSAA